MAKRKISLIGLVVVMICVLVFAPVVTAGIYFIHTVSGQLQHTASETVSMYLNEFTDRTDRMMESVQWLARAVAHRPYRGIRYNFGFTKRLYFDARGFSHLNMNIGEDDLFLQRILRDDNLSVVLSPRASVVQRVWGGLGWWTRQRRLYGAARRYYPLAVRNFIRWEPGSRLLFFLAAATAIAVMPLEYKLATAALVLLRYGVVFAEIWRITRRLGERGLRGAYFVYDLLSPFYEMLVALLCLRRDDRVWR